MEGTKSSTSSTSTTKEIELNSTISREFETNLPGGAGQLVAHCCCGRIHFATGQHSFYDEQSELEELREKAEKEPEQYLEDSENDSIGTYYVSGSLHVWNCPCRHLERMETFLVQGQAWIVAFYKDRSARLKREAAAAVDDLAALEVNDV